MASGLSSPWGILGIILLAVGIIMAIVGTVFAITMQNQSRPWWIWTLLIVGVILIIVGGIFIAVALSGKSEKKEKVYKQSIPMSSYDLYNQPNFGRSETYKQPVYRQPDNRVLTPEGSPKRPSWIEEKYYNIKRDIQHWDVTSPPVDEVVGVNDVNNLPYSRMANKPLPSTERSGYYPDPLARY